ncbi:glycoside hydrolase family 15 protein (plasmid) [Deinococcus sp. KNUC1210]|uniref:glycoside hydrolase family 15 protein n=1 Tax=Deinococcus sp. KNUC1210 TaxID=2917691 RepID=UPI001EEF99AF|nr:glycoside hydrolase family 15 protein [Deinococcus sp. KNUC1210]ULH18179.1 glycoside hydrolase family 15 protein [Deinococcus sp. KNUC1210]
MNPAAQRGVARLLAHQAASGAFPACPTFSQYPYAWLRDSTFIAYALDRSGEQQSAARYYRWVSGVVADLEGQVDRLITARRQGERISETQFLPTRFSLTGEKLQDDWPNFQLDGYGQWLWGLGQHLTLSGTQGLPDPYRRGAEVTLRYLQQFWQEPCFDCWEEFPYRWHTSTLASIFAGVQAMAPYFPAYEPLGEQIRTFINTQTITEGRLSKFIGYPVVDASLLWTAVPFGVFGVDDPVFQATLAQIERELLRDGVHRYSHDTYYGGGSWVLLTAWLGWVYARLGRREEALDLSDWVRAQENEDGLPEQTQHVLLSPPYLASWTERWGPPAAPLLWSQAMQIVLEQELHPAPMQAGTQ